MSSGRPLVEGEGSEGRSHSAHRLGLRGLGFLAGVDPRDVARLERLLPVLAFPTGTELDPEASTVGNVFVVRRGRLAILGTHPADGWTMLIAFAQRGDIYSTLGGVPAPPAIVLEDAEVTPFPERTLRALTQRYPQFGIDLAVALSDRIALLRDVVTSVGHMHMEDRLWTRLAVLMERVGIATREGPQLRIPLTHAQWAMLTGGSRESITLLLGRLRREGRIVVHDRMITIPWDVWNAWTSAAERDDPPPD